MTGAKRRPPTLTKAEALACLSVLGSGLGDKYAGRVGVFAIDRAVHAAARRAIKKLERIARDE